MGHNGSVLEPLKFGRGDGQLNYYMYNYRVRDLPATDLSLVML